MTTLFNIDCKTRSKDDIKTLLNTLYDLMSVSIEAAECMVTDYSDVSNTDSLHSLFHAQKDLYTAKSVQLEIKKALSLLDKGES